MIKAVVSFDALNCKSNVYLCVVEKASAFQSESALVESLNFQSNTDHLSFQWNTYNGQCLSAGNSFHFKWQKC